MNEKGDWGDVFASWDSLLYMDKDPDLDAWTTKFRVEQAIDVNKPALFGAVPEDTITKEQDDLINDVNVSSESSTSLVMCGLRVPTPIFLNGRYTPIFRHFSSTSNENVAIDTPKETDLGNLGQEEMDLEDISPAETNFDSDKPAKSSRLSRLFQGIRGFFRSKKGNRWNRL